jgi:hypothetical protein
VTGIFAQSLSRAAELSHTQFFQLCYEFAAQVWVCKGGSNDGSTVIFGTEYLPENKSEGSLYNKLRGSINFLLEKFLFTSRKKKNSLQFSDVFSFTYFLL